MTGTHCPVCRTARPLGLFGAVWPHLHHGHHLCPGSGQMPIEIETVPAPRVRLTGQPKIRRQLTDEEIDEARQMREQRVPWRAIAGQFRCSITLVRSSIE